MTGLPTQIEKGSTFQQTGPGPDRRSMTTTFLVEELEDLREIKLRCQRSGYYSHWWLTEAQGQTFTDVEIGIEPIGLLGRVIGVADDEERSMRKIDRREPRRPSQRGRQLRVSIAPMIASIRRKTWILTGSLENFRINVERGFDVIGFKQRRRLQAREFEPGDEIVFYVTGVQAFGGIARVTSEMFEDTDPDLASK